MVSAQSWKRRLRLRSGLAARGYLVVAVSCLAAAARLFTRLRVNPKADLTTNHFRRSKGAHSRALARTPVHYPYNSTRRFLNRWSEVRVLPGPPSKIKHLSGAFVGFIPNRVEGSTRGKARPWGPGRKRAKRHAVSRRGIARVGSSDGARAMGDARNALA
jgi:hypothetical protein